MASDYESSRDFDSFLKGAVFAFNQVLETKPEEIDEDEV